MSKSNWKKLIENCIEENREFKEGMDKMLESKIDDGWIDLDSSTPIEVFANKGKYTIEVLVGNEWEDCDKLTPIENITNFINFKDFEYRYKLKPLAPIQITEFEADILWHYACSRRNINVISNNGVLTKFNGREVIIL